MRTFGALMFGILLVFFVIEPVALSYSQSLSPGILGFLWKLSVFLVGVGVGAWLKK